MSGRITISILSLSMLFFLYCKSGDLAKEKKFSIVGKWTGVDHTGTRGILQFNKDGTVSLVIGGRIILDSNDVSRGTARYLINFNAEPKHLDLVGFDAAGNIRGKISMIFMIINPDTIKVRTHFNQIRPESFIGETILDTMIYRRIK